MKAEVVQQLSLLELASVDAELGRVAHRATHLAEQERFEAVQAEHREANDRLAVLSIALEDLDGQVNKFESEVDAVRQREDRDRSLLAGGNTDPKQLVELQHELETLERRQASLEDSLLEIMERREQMQNEQASQLSHIDELQSELSNVQATRDGALVELDQAKHRGVAARSAGLVARPRPSGDVRTAACPGWPGGGAVAGAPVRCVPHRDRQGRAGADRRRP